VLLLLFPDKHGDLRVVLTLRASNMSSYAGQVSLPGGKADFLDEQPFETARREAAEEIGLPRNAKNIPSPFEVEHLCELPTHLALTELGVKPCVALLHSGTTDASPVAEETLIPRLNTNEVEAIFSAPFEKFLCKSLGPAASAEPEHAPPNGNRKAWYRGVWRDWNDSNWRMHDFYLPRAKGGAAYKGRSFAGSGGDDEYFRIFGLTASILVNAARMAYGRNPEFPCLEGTGEEEMIARMLQRGRLPETRSKGGRITKQDLRDSGQKEKI
jgi:8-oxo-dGTP pyrophosphatase MutT (NUDIX family)